MPKHRHQTTISNADTKKVNLRFLNPKDDFAFKHIFTKPSHIDLLMHFLNTVFKGDKVITKIRLLFYSAILIEEQGNLVDPKWNYMLPEIYFVAILDFKFKGMPDDQYVHDVKLVETNSNLEFYKKLRYIYIELPSFTKKEDELKTDQDKWLFCLKHMGDLEDIPVSLEKDPIFKKLFDIAEVSNLTPAEMNAYQQSLKIKRDNYNRDQYILELGRSEERDKAEKEKAELKAKAEKEKKEMAQNTALKLKSQKISIEIISEATGLSIEEIQSL